jgi:mono/diheme cytochrome c family protein
MFRIRGLMVLGLAAGLSVLSACGGEAGRQEAAAGEGTAEAAEATAAVQEGQEQQQDESKLPEGVTTEMVAQGKELFAGPGQCTVCHGPTGEGVPGLGANLTDDEWTQSDGSYEGIVQTILNGVDPAKSTIGTAMPPKGGSTITDEQVKAVAAYVYTLSRGKE